MKRHTIRTRSIVAASVLAAALSVTGCSFNVHPTVSDTSVEQTLSDRLYELVGQRPDGVDCPGELDGLVGTTMRCELTAGADRYPIAVTVTSVEGSTVNFDFEVADQPMA